MHSRKPEKSIRMQYNMAKAEIIYPKNVGEKVAMNFT